MDRRRFLGAATGVALAAGWPATARGAPAGDRRRDAIIDTHTHFYDPTRPEGVPWPPRDDKLLYRTVLPKDYRALSVPAPVTGTVVVEASPWVQDNQWVLELAAREPFIVGFIGNLPLGTQEFTGHLRRFAANALFRGLRVGQRNLKDGLDNPAFRRDLQLLADRDLALDLVGGNEILALADRLATQTPSLRIVIDHLAGLGVDGKTPPADWNQGMKTLGARRNVYCKLSGLVEGTGRSDGTAPREVAFYRPVLDAMWKIFGPERLIYGSNWPVSERFAPLGSVQGIIGAYLDGHGSRAKELVFSESARAAYKLIQREDPIRGR